MTTIVFRDGIMASDTRAYSGSVNPIGIKTKIERLENGDTIGVSSSVPGGAETVRHWWDKCRPDSITLPESFTLLVIDTEGRAFYAKNTKHISGPLSAKFFAIGSGEEIAIGALEMGADAVQAVRVACKHDVWSNSPIDTIDVKTGTYKTFKS